MSYSWLAYSLTTALLVGLQCILEIRSSSSNAKYVSATDGSTDIRTCGVTRDYPCQGLAVLFNDGCTHVENSNIRLLPGNHFLPLFHSPIVLNGCSNFSIEADTTGVTIVAEPSFDQYTAYNRTLYHRNPNATCGLNYGPAFFGKASVVWFSKNRNVLLRGLDFTATNWTLDVFLLVDKPYNFTIDNCRFLELPSTKRAVGVFNPSGPVLVKNSFFRTHEQHRDTPSSFSDTIGKASLYILSTNSLEMAGARQVEVTGCEFVQTCDHSAPLPTFKQWKKEDSSSRFTWCAADNSHLLRIDVDGVTTNLHVAVRQSTFYSTAANKNCTSLLSAVSVIVRCRAANNTVSIETSNFTNFVGLLGSAIQVTSSLASQGNHFNMRDLLFTSNGLLSSTQDGGAVFFSINDNANLANTFNVSHIAVTHSESIFGSAISVRRGTSHDPCQGCLGLGMADLRCDFENSLLSDLVNEFIYTFLSLRPLFKPRTLGIRNVVMLSNKAKKGTIYSSRMNIWLGGTNQLSYNTGGVILAQTSLIQFSGSSLFESNIGVRGGALALLGGSSMDIYHAQSILFKGNIASEFGGAIYADAETTSLTYGQELTLSYSNEQDLICCIQGPYIREDAGKHGVPSVMTFHQNKASLQGNDIYAYSFALCPIIPILPPNVADDLGYRGPSPLGITNYTDGDRSLIHDGYRARGLTRSLSTSSDYLMLEGASCACVKRVRNYSLLLSNCSQDYAQSLFLSVATLNNTAHFIREELPQFKPFAGSVADFGSPLPLENLVFPWTGSFADIVNVEKMHSIVASDAGFLLKNKEVLSFEWEPWNIMLMPSPGEEFFLDIGLRGQFLDDVNNPVFIQLKAPPKNDSTGEQEITALLRLREIQLAHDDKLVFIPNRVNSLTIVGLPGSTGEIQVFSQSQIVNKQLLVSIPFQLSPCQVGFLPPVKEIYTGGKKTLLRDHMARWKTSLVRFPSGRDPFICTCVESEIVHCLPHEKISIEQTHWAGNIYHSSLRDHIDKMLCDDQKLGAVVKKSDAVCLNGKKVAFEAMSLAHSKAAFLFGSCLRDFCKDASHRKVIDQTSSIVLAISGRVLSTPCHQRHEGLLCSPCIPGFAVTPFYLECKDCSGATPVRVLITMAILGALLFVVTIFFTWGVSAELVSVLFFAQATAFVSKSPDPEQPHGQEYISRTLNLDWSFGMCLTPDLNGFTRLAWAFLTPLYLLLLLLTAYILSNFKALTKVFARRNCVRMFWLVILLAYGSLASTSFRMLRCITIEPKASVLKVSSSNQRLADHPDIECYKGDHLPFAILSWCIIMIVLVPLLLSLPFLHRWPRFKPFSDVYASIYQDNRRWWPGVDLIRRLLLAAVFAEADGEAQYIGILSCCVLFLTSQALLSPFKRTEENRFETLFLACLTLIAVLAGPQTTNARLVAIQVIFFVPIFTMIGFLLYRHFPALAVCVGSAASEKLGIKLTAVEKQKKEATLGHVTSVSKLRDPLLTDSVSNL